MFRPDQSFMRRTLIDAILSNQKQVSKAPFSLIQFIVFPKMNRKAKKPKALFIFQRKRHLKQYYFIK